MARVLITGCSSGIGRALVEELGARGHDVIASARRIDTIAGLDAAQRLELDVTDDRSVRAAVAAATPVDVLVNNAAITLWGPVELLPIDLVQKVLDTNVLGPLRMIQAVLPQMRARRTGRIVCVSTPVALRGDPLLGCYGSGKAALERLCESLRLEVGHLGVDALVASPGGVESSFGENRMQVETTEPDYVDLARRNARLSAEYAEHRMTSVQAAAQIADVIEAERPPLRTPIGAHAARLVRDRRTLDDEEYERRVLAGLGFPTAQH